MTSRVQRCVLALAFIPGCSDDGAASSSSDADSGTTAGTTTSGGTTTAGTTTVGTSSATSGTSGTSMGVTTGTSTATGDPSTGGGSTGPDFEPIDPSLLEWELLPAVGADPTKEVRQASLSITPSGEIVVSAISADTSWSSPWEVNAYRLDGSSWTVLGGGPALSSDTEVSGTSVAALDDEVLVTYRVDLEERLSILSGGAWSEPAIDPASNGFDSYEVAIDGQGRPLVLAVADGIARVYRRDGGAWAQLGGDLQASAIPFPGLGSLVTGLAGRVAASAGGAAHLFDGAQWLNLGAVTNGVAVNTRFAIDSDGNPIAAWREGSDVYAATWDPNAAEWVPFPGELNFEGPGADNPGLAVDPADTLFATWRELSLTVYVARFIGGVWVPYIGDGIPGGAGSIGSFPEIELDALGLPVVIWEATLPGMAGHIGVARAIQM